MEAEAKEGLAARAGSARFTPTQDGSNLLHIIDGDMEILVEIWQHAGISVVLKHAGKSTLLDFEYPPNATGSATGENQKGQDHE